ncbi:hypothetical protein KW801_03140 [Candidatus Saccharibacteria bacterium]|nr:hypothetical protein [Candidatus Saccharibacteria bacterium]
MPIVKKLALGVLSPLFIILLFVTAFDIGFVRTATHPTTVKRLIAESSIYDSVVPNVLQQVKSIETSAGTFSASDPTIQKAANAAITPQYIKQNTETAIDSIYQWLDGKTAQPDFKIDLSSAKASFADNVAMAVQQKLGSLPACTTAQNLAIARSGQFDAINASCLPRGVTAVAAAAEVKNSIVGNQDFLKNTQISAADIKNGNDNQSFFQSDSAKQIPKQYQRAKKTPLILSALTILTGVGIVFLSRSWQKGLRHVGISLAVIGLIMLLFAWAINRTVSTKVVPKIKVDNAIFQTDIRNLVTDLTQQIDKNYWFFGGLYTLVGAGSIVGAEIFHRRSQPAKVAAKNKDAPEAEAPYEPEPKQKT